MNIVTNHNMCKIPYDAIRDAMNGESYPMSLVGHDKEACTRAVNIGIDSHLEACSIEGQDSYQDAGYRLECNVSPKSLPTLVRRLFEDTHHGDEDDLDAGPSLAGSILMTLGFNDTGEQVGREALGL